MTPDPSEPSSGEAPRYATPRDAWDGHARSVICLIGPMASGKSTLGRAVARELGVPFADTDALVVAQHGPIAEIFSERGEADFRRLETEALRAALAAASVHGGVIATGGGAVVVPENRELLAGVFTAYLTITREAVAPRILRDRHRPLLATRASAGDAPPAEEETGPVERWAQILAEREPLYRAASHVVVDVGTEPVATNAARILSAYARYTQATEEQQK
ncbi:shikimate kinase [Zhihengliuella sp.]|uniref:shikimate kinase n=1 Tax=Zhihengliuella sp. TaxID=1954483 RepID=UPI002811ED0E|nr:shikimate kinase [Zhihengliuella sp.]